MTIRLFDVNNGTVVPTEHCYTLKTLKRIMDDYPETYLKVYAFLFYMTCPNPDLNPFFHVKEELKIDTIIDEVDLEESLDDEAIVEALEFCANLYETPTYRAYKGIKSMLDKLADYMESTSIEHGRDGNINSLISVASKFDQIRASYKGAFNDMKQEQESNVRGGIGLAYDQM